jgi:integrase
MRLSEATALTARRRELDHEPPRINVEGARKRTDQYRVTSAVAQDPRGQPSDADRPRARRHASTLAAQRKGGEEAFLTGYGTVVHNNNFHSRIWRRAVMKVFGEGAVPFEATIHDLRHAHASRLLAEGVPVLADRLGHDPAVLRKVKAQVMDASRNEPALAIARLRSD